MGVRLDDSPNSRFLVHNNIESSLVLEVKSQKHPDPLWMDFKKSLLRKLNELFAHRGDGVLRYKNRVCVSNDVYLRRRFLEEAHGSR